MSILFILSEKLLLQKFNLTSIYLLFIEFNNFLDNSFHGNYVELMKQEISDLKKHIGFWMRLVSNNVSHAFARKLSNSGVTVPEWVVLREMVEGGDLVSPSRIAEMTGLTRGAVTKLVDRLLAKKLFTRSESTEDRRYQELKLTNAAKQLIPKLALLADANDEEYFSILTKAERKTLTKILIKTAEQNNLTKFPIS